MYLHNVSQLISYQVSRSTPKIPPLPPSSSPPTSTTIGDTYNAHHTTTRRTPRRNESQCATTCYSCFALYQQPKRNPTRPPLPLYITFRDPNTSPLPRSPPIFRGECKDQGATCMKPTLNCTSNSLKLTHIFLALNTTKPGTAKAESRDSADKA